MIVQVTNSGDDLGANHFDLQIPGGGVGAFDGCTPQWRLPTSAWGERYGGVRSRQACDALPAPLRSGCYFRFHWFKGANNPNVNFSPVACPAALLAKSKCSRRGGAG